MRIDGRFNGPAGSGNGGWSAGAFAVAAGARVGGPPFQVTLRLPPPLRTELSVAAGRVLAGEDVVAEVAELDPGGVTPVVVPPVTLPDAVAAARAYPGHTGHPFPACYVCGPDRAEGDGLRIFPGPLPGGRTAAPWTVPADVTVPTVWAALDCPGGWTVLGADRVFVLGRIAARLTALPAPGSTCVVVAAPAGGAGRKAAVDSALYAPDGALLATAHATWIAVR
jgi:hypothetical protein